MAYTGDPLNIPADAVRLMVGDTNADAPELQDGEVAYFLSISEQDPLTAAIAAATALQGRYAGAVNESVGSVSISGGSRAAGYAELLQQLRRQATLAGIAPWAGGISRAEKRAARCDTDRVPPLFNRSMLQDEGARVRPREGGDEDCGGGLPGQLEPRG